MCYPIIDLRRYRPSVRWYVHALEEVLVRTLSHFGLQASTTSDVGVWIEGQRKVAAIGIAVSRWITMHGAELAHLKLRERSGNSPILCR